MLDSFLYPSQFRYKFNPTLEVAIKNTKTSCYYLLRRDRVKETMEKQVEAAFVVFSLVVH